jgi:uncharacterized RDD family membrane protein YckC
MQYASFVRRATAFLIDLVILPLVWMGTFLLAAFVLGFSLGLLDTSETTSDRYLDSLVGPVGLVLFFTVPVLYSAVFEAAAGGTPGKLLVKVRVARADGSKLGFGRALVRIGGKLLSTVLLGLGFLPAALTERHQALHDFMAGTVVLQGARERKRAAEPVLGRPGEQAREPAGVS